MKNIFSVPTTFFVFCCTMLSCNNDLLAMNAPDQRFLEEVQREIPDQQTLDALIAQGANVNAQAIGLRTTWETPLMIALQKKNRDLISYLLNKNADITTIRNRAGNTAFMEAVATNNLDIVQDLVDTLIARYPANNLIPREQIRETVLENEWTAAPIEICQLTLNHIRIFTVPGINTKNMSGLTALMIAVVNNNPDMVEYLLDLGANPNSMDLFNQTAFDRTENEAIRRLLSRDRRTDYDYIPEEDASNAQQASILEGPSFTPPSTPRGKKQRFFPQ